MVARKVKLEIEDVVELFQEHQKEIKTYFIQQNDEAQMYASGNEEGQ